MHKHKLAQILHRPLDLRFHLYIILIHTGHNDIVDQFVQTLPRCIAECFPQIRRNVFLRQDMTADRVIDIMIDISDLVRKTDDLSLQGMRHSTGLMV